ncbi:MAG: DUF1801 domain-containing protein [Angelakisella sp.]|nr:DUF1801 domain-containing protein [Angelakisella sp.]
MTKATNEVDSYIMALPEIQQEWMWFFVKYMREKHSNLEEVISFQMPTYKLGSGKLRNYIAFSPAKNHFSMHTMDFEYIAMMKESLASPGKGKGCVNVKYTNTEERILLLQAIEEIIKRKQLKDYGKQA